MARRPSGPAQPPGSERAIARICTSRVRGPPGGALSTEKSPPATVEGRGGEPMSDQQYREDRPTLAQKLARIAQALRVNFWKAVSSATVALLPVGLLAGCST